MSCSNGNCSCGSACKCGNDCGCGSGMYPDIEKVTNVATIIDGVAPKTMYGEGSEMSFGAEGGDACKCGANCTCNPCKC